MHITHIPRAILKPSLLAAAIAFAAQPAGLAALELGGITPLSGPGQPLFAEVRLNYRQISELNNLTLGVQPASGQAVDDMLRSISARLVRDAAGAAFIELTSHRPLSGSGLKFALQLEQGGQSRSREYQLDFTASAGKPNDGARRGQRIERLKQSAPVAGPAVGGTTTASAQQYGPVQAGETLFSVARRYRGDPPLPVMEVMQRLQAANPAAFADGRMDRLLAGSILQIPPDLSLGGETLAEAPAALPRAGLDLSLDRRMQPAHHRRIQSPPGAPQPARKEEGAPAGLDTRAAEGITLKLSTLETRLTDIESRLVQQDKAVGEALRQSDARLTQQDKKLADMQQQLSLRLDSLERAQQAKPAVAGPAPSPAASDAAMQQLRAELGKRLDDLQALVVQLENSAKQTSTVVLPAQTGEGQAAPAPATVQALQELSARIDGLQTAVEQQAAAQKQSAAGASPEAAALTQKLKQLEGRIAALSQPPPADEAAEQNRLLHWSVTGALGLLLALLAGWLAHLRRKLSHLEQMAGAGEGTHPVPAPDDGGGRPSQQVSMVEDDSPPTWVPPPDSVLTDDTQTQRPAAAAVPDTMRNIAPASAPAPATPAAAQPVPAPEMPVDSRSLLKSMPKLSVPQAQADNKMARALSSLDQELMSEIDLHISFENYREAAAMLTKLCDRYPNDIPMRVKLLTMLHLLGDRARFVEEAETLSTIPGARKAREWEDVQRMGRELAPDDSLFGNPLSTTGVFQMAANNAAPAPLFTPMSPVDGESVPIEDLLRQGNTDPAQTVGFEAGMSSLTLEAPQAAPGSAAAANPTLEEGMLAELDNLPPPGADGKRSLENELLSWMDRSMDINQMLGQTGQQPASGPHEELQAGLEEPLSMQSLRALELVKQAEVDQQTRTQEIEHSRAA
jgi:pilus assembly protein FimV